MKNKCALWLSLLLFALPPGALTSQEKKSPRDLDPRYRKWLEEEVVYIATAREKDVFLRLGSDKERDIFIEAFWKQRDPTPGTPQNEFREQHYRRIAEANDLYGRDTPRPGWMTDRGRIHIILGPPLDVERYTGESFVYPSEVWTYKGDERYGLPPYFRVFFFKARGAGEYRFYSPANDGMESLIIDKKIAGRSPDAVYEELFRFDPELAEAALSLVPGERPAPGDSSLASEILMANVVGLPQKKIDDEYAAKLLSYKDIVEVDYTANYIRSGHLLALIQDDEGVFYVHFSLEPSSLSVDSIEERFVAHFEVNVNVADLAGRTVFQYGKSFPLELNEESLEQLKASSYALQDAFPLIPGSYNLNVIMKNTVSKEFTTFEATVHVPEAEGAPLLSPLLLGYQVENNTDFSGVKKPFLAGGCQVMAQSNRLFAKRDRLVVFSQVHHLSPELEEGGSILTVISGEERELARETTRLADLRDRTNLILEFPLAEFPTGDFKARVSLLDGTGREVVFEEKEFQVTYAAGVARPWIISKVLPLGPNTRTELDFMLANQHWAVGHLEEAASLLEKCFRQAPQLRYTARLAEFRLQRKEYGKARDLLLPLLEKPQENYQWLAFLGRARQALGEYRDAAGHYRDYLVRIGTNIEVLNALGDCHERLGEKEQALTAWNRSLELAPEQPELRKKVEALRSRENDERP